MKYAITLCLAAVVFFGASALAVDGIALSTHRPSGSDSGPGVSTAMFGSVVRHDIKDSQVVARTVIYDGKARSPVISQTGDKAAFIKLNGRIWVMNIDGTGQRELANSKNANSSYLSWPVGDWVYYNELCQWPDGNWNQTRSAAPAARTIRRINIITGDEEFVCELPHTIWQISLTPNATPQSGKFAITTKLFDFADPSKALNDDVTLACGTCVSPSGQYVSEIRETHSDARIYDWSLKNVLKEFAVNDFQPHNNDGRVSFYRPRWSNNSDRWIVLTHGADFGATQRTNMVLYNWMDGVQIQVTNNDVNTTISDEGEAFWLAGVASELGFGLVEGKAPFTVSLGDGKLQGNWQWDFGDGTRKTATSGKHTYTQPGEYTVTATQRDRTLRQTVVVLPRVAPKVTDIVVLDDRHVLLSFNEPIQLVNAKAMVASTRATAKVRAGATGSTVLIELPASLMKDDAVILAGVLDKAQVPNPPENPRIEIKLPSWPSNRKGIAFIWENRHARNMVYDYALGHEVNQSVFVWDGISRFDRHGAMVLEGHGKSMFTAGPALPERYPFTSASDTIGKACNDSISMEVTFTTNDMDRSRGEFMMPMVSMARLSGTRGHTPDSSWREGTFWFGQQNDELRLVLATESMGRGYDAVTLTKLPAPGTYHVIVSYSPGKLVCYVNGEKVHSSDRIKGKPQRAASPWRLEFAGESVGVSQRWRGTIEGVAFYNRVISPEEARANYEAYQTKLAGRRVVQQIEVEAKLTAASRVKSIADIAPYDEALVVNEYEIVRVLKGEYGGKTIRVAQWGVVNRQLQAINNIQIGQTNRLVLEPYSDNPQLEEIFIVDSLDDNFDLDLYVEAQN